MFKKSSYVFGTGIIIMSSLFSQASADPKCLPVHGKASNNAQLEGRTQGVAALAIGNKKLKCSIVGIPQSGIERAPNFLHNIVCDNKASSDEAQSQLTLKTWFTSEPIGTGSCVTGNPYGEASFSFEELSIPIPESARGGFTGVTDEGSIIIQGDYNCNGGITMKFHGNFCFSD